MGIAYRSLSSLSDIDILWDDVLIVKEGWFLVQRTAWDEIPLNLKNWFRLSIDFGWGHTQVSVMEQC